MTATSEREYVTVLLHADKTTCWKAARRVDCNEIHDYIEIDLQTPTVDITLENGEYVTVEVAIETTLDVNATFEGDPCIYLTNDGLNTFMAAWCDANPNEKRGWLPRDLDQEPCSIARARADRNFVELEWWFSETSLDQEPGTHEPDAWGLVNFPYQDTITY